MDNSLNSLKEICDQIEKVISLSIDKDNPDEITGKINDLTCLLATSSHSIALSKMFHGKKLQEFTQDNTFSKYTATDKKNIFNGLYEKECYYVDYTIYLNKAIVHTIDGLRSIISYKKSEINNINN